MPIGTRRGKCRSRCRRLEGAPAAPACSKGASGEETATAEGHRAGTLPLGAHRHGAVPAPLSRAGCSRQFGRASAPMITTSGTVLRRSHRSLPERHPPGSHRSGCRREMSAARRIK
jgi:hypothetical protein